MSSADTIDLETGVRDVCGHVNVAYGQLVGIVVEMLQSRSWAVDGVRSPEHWLTWKTGVSPSRARDLVLLAGRASELPVTIATLAGGLLSFDQAVTIARYAPAGYDVASCELAKSLSVPQLSSVLRRYSFTPRHADGTVATEPPADTTGGEQASSTDNADERGATDSSRNDASGCAAESCTESSQAPSPGPSADCGCERPDRVSSHFDEAGRFRLNADVNPLFGAEIDAALREARDALYRAGNHGVTWADALVEVCRRSLAATGSVSRSDRYRVYLHLTPDSAWINGGPRLPAAVRSQILCDTTLNLMSVKNGTPIDVGRATRTIPAHTRRAVLDHDQVCRFPGCTRRLLEVHHMVHWENDGPTDMANLVGLCSDHHHRHHDGTFTIEGDPQVLNGLVFRHRNGSPFTTGPNPTAPSGPPPAPPAGNVYRHPSGERVQSKWIDLTPRQPSEAPPPSWVTQPSRPIADADDDDSMIRYGTPGYNEDDYVSDSLNPDGTWKTELALT